MMQQISRRFVSLAALVAALGTSALGTSALSQEAAPKPELRFSAGRLEVLLPRAAGANATLTVTTPGGTREVKADATKGDGTIVPLPLVEGAPRALLLAGQPISVKLSGGQKAEWTVQNLLRFSPEARGFPLKAFVAGDSESSGTLDKTDAGSVATLNYGGVKNNYVPFGINVSLPEGTVGIGAFYSVVEGAPAVLGVRVRDNQKENFGYMFDKKTGDAATGHYTPLSKMSYRWFSAGQKPDTAVITTAPQLPASVFTILIEPTDHKATGAGKVNFNGLFVIRQMP